MQRRGHLVQRREHLVQRHGHLMQTRGHLVQRRGHLVQTRGHLVQTRGHLVQTRGIFVQTRGIFVQTRGVFVQTRGIFVQTRVCMRCPRGIVVCPPGIFGIPAGDIACPNGICRRPLRHSRRPRGCSMCPGRRSPFLHCRSCTLRAPRRWDTLRAVEIRLAPGIALHPRAPRDASRRARARGAHRADAAVHPRVLALASAADAAFAVSAADLGDDLALAGRRVHRARVRLVRRRGRARLVDARRRLCAARAVARGEGREEHRLHARRPEGSGTHRKGRSRLRGESERTPDHPHRLRR